MNEGYEGKPNTSLVSLRDQINADFNKDELEDLCFELGLDYDRLSGDNTGDKARELILYMVRRNQLAELVGKCRELRPKTDWSSWKNRLAELPPDNPVQISNPDEALCEFYRMVFNRPSFRSKYGWETDSVPFKEAMDLTLQAVNTGELRNRHGFVTKYAGRLWFADRELRSKLEQIQKYLHSAGEKAEVLNGTFDPESREEISYAIDLERNAIIGTLNGMLARFNIPALPLPTGE